MPLPLKNVRVLAVQKYVQDLLALNLLPTRELKIKIENTSEGGDFARWVGTYFCTSEHSQIFHAYNRNKNSLTIDLSKNEGITVFQDMSWTADAVALNLRGDLPEKLGLTYVALKGVNEKIVFGDLSA